MKQGQLKTSLLLANIFGCFTVIILQFIVEISKYIQLFIFPYGMNMSQYGFGCSF